MRKLIFGCGYLGKRVAKQWLDAGATVYVVTRSPGRAQELCDEGFLPLIGDVADANTLHDLPAVDTVLFSVGYERPSVQSIHSVYAGGLKNVLRAFSDSEQPLIYISTTGVYGPAGGGWIDETTPTNPQREGGKASLAAEQLLEQRPNSLILRFSGIYGPNRIPYLENLREAKPISAPSEGWLNLIHVEDGAKVVLAGETWAHSQPDKQSVFFVSDGNPVIRSEYYHEVARQIGAPIPTFTTPDPNSPAAARARSDKRVNNRKMIDSFHVDLNYPSYLQGLAAILGSNP
ncbi:MAG: SDR family oxidoreductase [Pirellulales bacterium]|nr:SDR family oxidoreductase [Pirellulales bacterium]